MSDLTAVEASRLLGVSPDILRKWEMQFSFPVPRRDPGKRWLFRFDEIMMLRDGLLEGHSIAAVIAQVRAAVAAEDGSLLEALLSGDRKRAEHAMQSALAGRSVEAAVEEVLLPTVDAIVACEGTASLAWSFASAWVSDWLRRPREPAPPGSCRGSLLILDGSRSGLDPAAVFARALELFCVRAGIMIRSCPVERLESVRDAVRRQHPVLAVIVGGASTPGSVGRWAAAITSATGARARVATYRTGDHYPRPATPLLALPPGVGEATERIIEWFLLPATAAAERGGAGHARPTANAPMAMLHIIRHMCDQDSWPLSLEPMVDLASGERVGYSATLKFAGVRGSAASPPGFGLVAERYALQTQLDRLLVRSAVRLAERGDAVAVELTGAAVAAPDFVRQIELEIVAGGLRPGGLVIELSQATITSPSAAAFVQGVRAAGCAVVVSRASGDVSRLGYLKQLPVDGVKLASTLVVELHRDASRALQTIEGFMEQARRFGVFTAIEGVDDDEVRDQVLSLGLDRAQGPLWRADDPAAPTEAAVSAQDVSAGDGG